MTLKDGVRPALGGQKKRCVCCPRSSGHYVAKSRAIELPCVIVTSGVAAVPSTPASFLTGHCSPRPSGSLLGPSGTMGWRNWGLAGVPRQSPYDTGLFFCALPVSTVNMFQSFGKKENRYYLF